MTIDPESFLAHMRLAAEQVGVVARRLPMLVALASLLTCSCSSSRQPPEGTPIIRETRVWMLGDPGSANFVAVVSPWSFRYESFFLFGFESRQRTMLEQTAHVFLCDAASGSARKLCEIQVPDSVGGFRIEDDGVRFVVIGWDEDAAYIELRAEPKAGKVRGPQPYLWYRVGKDGSCTPLTARPSALLFRYDIPGVPPARDDRYFPFPAADDYSLVADGSSIKLWCAGVWIVEFAIDPVTYDLRPVDLGPDSKRFLREAMDAAKKRRPQST